MIDLLQRLDITPTIPVAARTLERHPEFRLELEQVDPAIHGYRHVAYADMTRAEQEQDLHAARGVFKRHGLPVRGFRAPYLAANSTTRELLAKAGFLYDSSVACIATAAGDSLFHEAQRAAARRYAGVSVGTANVTVADGLVEIPVALPDDEILVDGLAITNPETLTRVMDRMLDAAYAQSSALVLQIHPERFPLFAIAIEHVSRRAAEFGAWRAPLSEIAHHAARAGVNGSSSFVFAVSGDLDAASLGDFASRLWEHGQWR
jgi:peptidoglycan/xylan/chitin deacetylase (PgdA/CDA1 family)